MEAAHGALSQNILAGIAMGAESMAPARTQHQPRSTNTKYRFRTYLVFAQASILIQLRDIYV